jgi:indoleamine 2,3-dioxygenase
MTITTLLLEKYDVSPITGFLPSKPPLKRLSNEYFAPWENMMDDFNDLLLAGKLREKIHKLPLLDSRRLQTIEEYRRAFLIMCMLSHSYVWGKLEQASEVRKKKKRKLRNNRKKKLTQLFSR